MRSLGRAWAVPMTLVFSSGALITLGQTQIAALVSAYQHHQPLDYVTIALLAITFVIVGGMDLTLLNSAVELRDARLRGVDPSKDPYTRGARLRVWVVSLVESATFTAVAYQLDRPPTFERDPWAAAVGWGFILMRALVAPVCAMYLATLGKRAIVRREMYGSILLTVGGTIQQILENLQFAADERLIEPLWRMQVLVDRASRARDDEEMDGFDDQLLAELARVRELRDRLSTGTPGPANVTPDTSHPVATDGHGGASGPMLAAQTSTEAVTEHRGGDEGVSGAPPTVRWSRDLGERIERWALGDAHALEGEDPALVRTGADMGGGR
jgi:hypothetical protein